MNYLSRKNAVTAGLYIVLAICVLTVIGICISSLANKPVPGSIDGGDSLLYYEEQTEPRRALKLPPPEAPTSPEPTESVAVINSAQGIKADEITTAEETSELSKEPTSAEPAPAKFAKVLAGRLIKVHNPDMPAYNPTMNDYRTHAGIDIAADIGTPVMALSDGEITAIEDDPLMGKTITIAHADELVSVYANLDTVLPDEIKQGTKVKAGDTIAFVGESSLIEGVEDDAHLHFETIKSGIQTNPLNYVEYQ